MENNSLIKQALIATLCEHPKAEALQKKAFKGNGLLELQKAMTAGGVKLSKKDFFTADEDGDYLISTPGFWKNFDKIVDVLKESNENFTQEDFLHELNDKGATLLKGAELDKSLSKLFNEAVWNDVTDMEELWYQVTPYLRKDFENKKGILPVKRQVLAKTGQTAREDDLAEMNINYLDVVDIFKSEGHFEMFLRTLQKNNAQLTKADVFLVNHEGDTMFANPSSWKSLSKIVSLLDQNKEQLDVSDFLFKRGHHATVLEQAERADALPHVFDPKIWVGRVSEMAELWTHVKLVPQAQLSEYTIDERIADVEDMTYGALVAVTDDLSKGTLMTVLNPDEKGFEVVPLGLKTIWNDIDQVQAILAQKDEKITLSDLRQKTGTNGGTCLMVAAKSGCLDQVLTMVSNAKDKLELDDFLNKDNQTTTLLDILVRREELEKVFTAEIWAGRMDEMRSLWHMVPFEAKSQVDFDDVVNKVSVASVTKMGGGATVRRRPKKGPKSS